MNDNELKEFEQTLETFGSKAGDGDNSPKNDFATQASPRPRENQNLTLETKKWRVLSETAFGPCGDTMNKLPARAFRINFDDWGNPVFHVLSLQTDELLHLPDSQTEKVLASIEKFWNSKEKFTDRKFLFKRGILLTGAPGGGKTSCIQLLVKQILERGGVVVIAENPVCATRGLETLRKIEPDRPLICIMEDLDELVRRYTDAEWLALLDGESQINNVVYIATTNYPEKLDRRFVNRPSRFDEIINIPMPSAAARRYYLENKILAGDLDEKELTRWVNDSEGFSVAHLRELYVSVFCLERSYEEVIKRLQIMQKVKFKETGAKTMGFLPEASMNGN